MYIDNIVLKNFRTFRAASIDFVHPDQSFDDLDFPRPKLRNVNLLLGNNGAGKSALLKAIALSALGPAVGRAGIYPYRFVRREPISAGTSKTGRPPTPSGAAASISSSFSTHAQDQLTPGTRLLSTIEIRRTGDLDVIDWVPGDADASWEPIFSEKSDAFFFVGYGATRRVEQRDNFDPGTRRSRSFTRAQRVLGLFEDSYSLAPLNSWLPVYMTQNPGRYKQVLGLVDKLLGRGHFRFTGEMEDGEYVFERSGLRVPFPAMSDGYRAFLGWVGDLLYHVCETCPPGKKLVENRGIVMIDEIDLHLHPKWQLRVLPTLAAALPKIQFIVTSHSPLIVGSLEWSNIIVMRPAVRQASRLERIESAVHGLDADQVLLTEFFGLETTRAPAKAKELKDLTLMARGGDADAALKVLQQMSKGTESAS